MLQITLAAEKIGQLGPLPITNSLLATWLVMGVLFVGSWAATRKLSLKPEHGQSIAELVIAGLYDFFHQVTGKYTDTFFPLLASLFLVIITSNWMGLLPGFGTIGQFHTKEAVVAHESTKEEPSEASVSETAHEPEFIPVLRAATADLNMTVGLAIVAVVMIQYYGFRMVGKHYSSRFFNLTNPINFYVGILELISDLSKVISFAFRLFGNIFAGEVLLAVIAFLIPFLVPLPFLTMELFVGFIQALVFSMLTAVFINIAVSHGEEHGH